MYKKQLTWQKILCFAALVACGLAFLYALGVSTDMYDGLYHSLPEEHKLDKVKIPGSEVYYYFQPFNRQLLSYSIVLLLLSLLLFITNTHKRRRYYIGNAVSTFVFAGGGVAFSVWTHQQIEYYKGLFLQIDFEEYLAFATKKRRTYIDSTFWFDAHYAVIAVILLVCVLLILNYVWKLRLMRAEKRLIEEGKEGSK